jgi:threonine/homoserine/homoserine lactone efflux protein
MPELSNLIAFSLISLGMVLTPGPNMLYLISRSMCQGKKAGFISLVGIALGFLFYMLCAALGITSFLMSVPYAYDSLRLAGAFYLLYLAWQTLKPNGRSLFQPEQLPVDSNGKLLMMGFTTNLLNPKIAVMYFSLLPQFIVLDGASILHQSLILGSIQILISVSINAFITIMAGSIAVFLSLRPKWVVGQRWLMGSVLAALSARMFLDSGL